MRSLPVTITFAVTFPAWSVVFFPFAVTFAAWFITLNFALGAILVSFVLVVRIRPFVGKQNPACGYANKKDTSDDFRSLHFNLEWELYFCAGLYWK